MLETASIWVGTGIIWLFGGAIVLSLLWLFLWLVWQCFEMFYSLCVGVRWIVAFKFWSWRIKDDARLALQQAIEGETRWASERELHWYVRLRRGTLWRKNHEASQPSEEQIRDMEDACPAVMSYKDSTKLGAFVRHVQYQRMIRAREQKIEKPVDRAADAEHTQREKVFNELWEDESLRTQMQELVDSNPYTGMS